MKRFLSKKYIIGAIVAIVVVGGGFAIFRDGNGGKEQVTVIRGDLTTEVSVTGKTKANNEVELGFDMSGRIARSLAKVGSTVYQGATIAELDNGELLANLAKEQAVLAEEQENLSGEGERVESSIREAYAASDNAVRNKIDQFFKTPRDNPYFEVKFSDGNFVHYFAVPTDVAVDLNNSRRSIETLLTAWQLELASLNSSNAKSFSNRAIERTNTVSNFLDKVAYTINSFTPAEFAYDSTVAGYKTSVDSARSSVSTARQSLINADSAGEARVNQIKSSILAIQSNINKSRIIAPFTGTITRQDAKVGEVAAAGNALVSLISDNEMYVEANVSEINVGKIALGNSATIELDAYPDQTFTGTVTFIDPGETIVDKVVNYKVRIDLADIKTTFPNGLKSGLTANVKISASKIENVLSVPIYAVIDESGLPAQSGKHFVNKIVDGKPTKVEVELGIQGSNGNVEIKTGLAEGDKILLP